MRTDAQADYRDSKYHADKLLVTINAMEALGKRMERNLRDMEFHKNAIVDLKKEARLMEREFKLLDKQAPNSIDTPESES